MFFIFLFSFSPYSYGGDADQIIKAIQANDNYLDANLNSLSFKYDSFGVWSIVVSTYSNLTLKYSLRDFRYCTKVVKKYSFLSLRADQKVTFQGYIDDSNNIVEFQETISFNTRKGVIVPSLISYNLTPNLCVLYKEGLYRLKRKYRKSDQLIEKTLRDYELKSSLLPIGAGISLVARPLKFSTKFLTNKYLARRTSIKNKGLIKMSDEFRSFDLEYKVLYFSEEMLEKHSIYIRNTSEGPRLFQKINNQFALINENITAGARLKDSYNDPRKIIFVVDEFGRFLFVKPEIFNIHHSSLGFGRPVYMAGEMIIKNGKILKISNRSGHYRPEPEALEKVIKYLRDQGIELTDDMIEYIKK